MGISNKVNTPDAEIDPILAMPCRRERLPSALSGFRRNDVDGGACDQGWAVAMDLGPDNP